MAIAYYGVRLSPNWVETPEGYVIFKNAVIGRSGFQTYKGRELDKQELADQGITVDDDQDVNLYRDPSEVFSDKTIASFLGKSVTDGHPEELIDLDSVKRHEQGQLINVRAGSEALESGDLPLLSDLIVKSKNLIDKIKAGLRELSCGYNYHVLKDGSVIKQVDIIGNHVAIVENARAGREAVIVDSVTPAGDILMTIPILDRILSSNRKSKLANWAKDAKPEEVADIVDQIVGEIEKNSHHSVATDSTPAKDVKDAKDDAKDAASDRKRFHDAVDRLLEHGETQEKTMDADIEELGNLFKKWSSEEKKESSHTTDSDTDDDDDGEDEAEDEAADDSDADDEEEKEKEAKDEEAGDAFVIEPSDRPVSVGPGTDELRKARRQGARDALKLLKPIVAKSGNKKLIAAFDTALKSVQGKSTGKTSGGYGKFAHASNNRGREAQDSVDNGPSKQVKFMQDAEKLYRDIFVTGNQKRS
jgi:hypothetical protein